MESKETTVWAMLCHLSALGGYIVPFGNIIFPFAVWAFKKDESPLIDNAGKESMNFQISIMLYVLMAYLLTFILIGFLLLPLIAIANIVLIIIASVKARAGEAYRYPWCVRLIK